MNSSHVRVFQSQDILCPDNDEPLCIASSNSLFWVALASGVIRGYSTQSSSFHPSSTTLSTTTKANNDSSNNSNDDSSNDDEKRMSSKNNDGTSGNADKNEPFHRLYELRPLWPIVVDMCYLDDLKRLITIEKRPIQNNQTLVMNGNDEKMATHQQVCRIYHFLWDQKECKTKIGVCTLPIGINVKLINVCNQSNLIQVHADRMITLWAFPFLYASSSSASSSGLGLTNSQISMAPVCILKLYCSWNIKCMSIFNQFMGYGSDTDVRIVRFKLMSDLMVMDSSTAVEANESSLSKHEDKPLTLNSSKVGIRNEEANGNRMSNKSSEESELCTVWGVSQCAIDAQNYVEVRFNSTNYDLVPSPATSTYPLASSLGVNRKNDKAYEVMGKTPTVDHPTFVDCNYIENCTNLLHKHFTQSESARSIHFIKNISNKKEFYEGDTGMRCIISTSNKGYVYDISKLQLLSEFDYTGECIRSAVNSLFLFAITPAGMEIWSVLGSKQGCLLKFHPFIGLKSVIATNRKVVLMSKFSSKENVTIAAYYNHTTSETVILSDIRSVDKLSSGGKTMGSLLPIFSSWRKQKQRETPEKQQQVAPKVEEKITYSYNIYVLDVVELCEVYEDILEKAHDAEEENDEEKHVRLLMESHSLLQSKYYNLLAEERKAQDPIALLQLRSELNTYTQLLKKSFGLLGDAYLKKNKADRAASCFSQSDRLLHTVYELLQSNPASLIRYLESVLFNASKSLITQHNEEIGNDILKLYKQYAPHRLSTLILDSSLACYDKQLGIELLMQFGGEIMNLPNTSKDLDRILSSSFDNGYNSDSDLDEEKIPDEAFDLPADEIDQDQDLQNELEEPTNAEDEELLSWWSDTRPKDSFALALLLLGVNESSKAVKLLSSVDSQTITDHIASNPHLLMDQGKVSSFGHVMRTHFCWCLLEALVRLLTKPVTSVLDSPKPVVQLSVQDVIALLTSNEDTKSNNRMLIERYLSIVLLARDWIKTEFSSTYCNLATCLYDYYLEDLKEYSNLLRSGEKIDRSQSLRSLKSVSELKEWCSCFAYSMMDRRHRWLNDMTLVEIERYLSNTNQTETNNDSAETRQPSSELIHKTVVRLLEQEPTASNFEDIFSTDPLFRLLYTLFNAQSLLCFIGSDHQLYKKSIVMIPVEPSKYFSSNDTDADDVFVGAKTLTSRQQFRPRLSQQVTGFFQHTSSSISLNNEAPAGVISLQVLSFTVLGQHDQSFDTLLTVKPELTFIYGNHYCKRLHEWKSLTDRLIEQLRKDEGQTSSSSPLVTVFEKTLWYLAKILVPEDFLTLIPKDGDVSYFLPFIRYCFSCACSNSCYEAMLDIQRQKEYN